MDYETWRKFQRWNKNKDETEITQPCTGMVDCLCNNCNAE
jgi:hypothetical protein